jgi:hypothetical protein
MFILLVLPVPVLQVLVELGVLSESEMSQVIVTHIPAVRVGVAGLAELTLTGVMDAGVSPRLLLDIVKRCAVKGMGKGNDERL